MSQNGSTDKNVTKEEVIKKSLMFFKLLIKIAAIGFTIKFPRKINTIHLPESKGVYPKTVINSMVRKTGKQYIAILKKLPENKFTLNNGFDIIS